MQEFAQMTPVQLLHATQLAAGDSQLTKWHADLIARSKDQKEANTVGSLSHLLVTA